MAWERKGIHVVPVSLLHHKEKGGPLWESPFFVYAMRVVVLCQASSGSSSSG